MPTSDPLTFVTATDVVSAGREASKRMRTLSSARATRRGSPFEAARGASRNGQPAHRPTPKTTAVQPQDFFTGRTRHSPRGRPPLKPGFGLARRDTDARRSGGRNRHLRKPLSHAAALATL